VWLSDIIGFCNVDQQTPLAVIGDPPVLVTLPPDVAVVVAIGVVDVVMTDGSPSIDVNESFSP